MDEKNIQPEEQVNTPTQEEVIASLVDTQKRTNKFLIIFGAVGAVFAITTVVLLCILLGGKDEPVKNDNQSSHSQNQGNNVVYSEGLEFTSNGDGTCSVSGIGTCTDTDIVIPLTSPAGDSVTTIGFFAFSSCDSLTSVTIPDSVTTIDNYAFSWCYSLTSVTIPDSVTTIGNQAFSSCDSLTSVTIGDSVTTIGERAFNGCSSLTSVTIPDSVTTIGSYAFSDCTSLTSVTIPDSVTYIGEYAFSYCTSLASITIPDSVTTIGWYAFEDCRNLKSVTIGDSVTTIGYGAFASCTSLTDVYYKGSEAEWAEISIYGENDALINANITYNYTE